MRAILTGAPNFRNHECASALRCALLWAVAPIETYRVIEKPIGTTAKSSWSPLSPAHDSPAEGHVRPQNRPAVRVASESCESAAGRRRPVSPVTKFMGNSLKLIPPDLLGTTSDKRVTKGSNEMPIAHSTIRSHVVEGFEPDADPCRRI